MFQRTRNVDKPEQSYLTRGLQLAFNFLCRDAALGATKCITFTALNQVVHRSDLDVQQEGLRHPDED